MGLKQLLIATFILFFLALYLVVAGPVIDGVGDATLDATTSDATHDQVQEQHSFVRDVALLYVPLIIGLGAVLYGYSGIVSREGYRGR